MKPDPRFTSQPRPFWACVRILSQEIGYTVRLRKIIKVPTLEEIKTAFSKLGLNPLNVCLANGNQTELARGLQCYFQYRAEILNTFVKPRLMDKRRASDEFEKIRDAKPHECPIPMNKQKGDKKKVAYLTAIANMLMEENIDGIHPDYDPRILTCVTRDDIPLRTLSRRVDGAFPSAINPIAIWEIKEYYHTTTFGSRVADGVYETLLDGMELEELRQNEGIHVQHYLMLDGDYTWWDCGRSYLCRIIDMLHMGCVDEVLFGYEVIERLPEIARSWVQEYRKRKT